MVHVVSDQHIATAINSHPVWVLELPRPRALAADCAQVAAVGTEHLHPVVVTICD